MSYIYHKLAKFIYIFPLSFIGIFIFSVLISNEKSHRNLISVEETDKQFVRKFLIVETDMGLGNRISGIISCGFLAYLMDRVLILDWKSTPEHP